MKYGLGGPPGLLVPDSARKNLQAHWLDFIDMVESPGRGNGGRKYPELSFIAFGVSHDCQIYINTELR